MVSLKKSVMLVAFYLFLTPLPVIAKEEVLCLRVAVTPSVYNSTILTPLLSPFEKKNRLRVDVVAAETEKALKLAENGEVDAVIVNDPDQEMAFMEKGFGSDHKSFMHSYFMIVGPPSDPAKVKGERANYAFYKIAEKMAIFVSGGNKSEAVPWERRLWDRADVKKLGKWYIEAGKDMDETLMVADEKRGYTLSDRFTYIAMKDMIRIVALVDKDPNLKNVYSIMAVNPNRYTHVKYGTAVMLIEYLSSKEAQEIINGFKITGEQLFYPGE